VGIVRNVEARHAECGALFEPEGPNRGSLLRTVRELFASAAAPLLELVEE